MNPDDILFAPIGPDKTTQLLIRARGFVDHGWCRGSYAEDDAGNRVDPKDERAVAWSALGAILAALDPERDSYWRGLVRLLIVVRGSVDDFNDRQEAVEPVLALFDRAIAAGGR